MSAALSAQGLSLAFGGLTVLDDVSFSMTQDEVMAIIGPNGAGKTALLNCLTGIYRPHLGRVRLADVDITGVAPHKIVSQGLGRTFQGTRIFASMTVLDNVLAGRHTYLKSGPLRSLLFYPWCAREEREQRDVAERAIEWLGLQAYRNARAGDLPYGLRKRVDLARVFAMEPRVLLLDEPMAGLNHDERIELSGYLRDLHTTHRIPLLLVEHDMSVIRALATKVIVLNFGTMIAAGSAEEVARDPMVIDAYLGSRAG